MRHPLLGDRQALSRRAVRAVAALAALVGTACGASTHEAPRSLAEPTRTSPAAAAETAARDDVDVVESFPQGTPLDHPDVPDAATVWPALVDAATTSIDVAQFYLSDAPGERLAPTLAALRRAGTRGVRVRLLVERAFLARYPEPAGSLGRAPGIELRVYDALADRGGILHAKYFVVDGRVAFLGSQNFDWRALDHILEVGAIVRGPAVVRALGAVFAHDWARAGGAAPAAHDAPPAVVDAGAAASFLTASPPDENPEGVGADLDALVSLLDGAKRSLRVCVLVYRATFRDGARPFPTLDAALRRAAARGVAVHLAVSSWSEDSPAVRALAGVPGVEVTILRVPPIPGRDIPFARVVHAKFVVADDDRAWIGTSNWEGDYFASSRNVALLTSAPRPVRALGRIFDDAVRALGGGPPGP